MIPKIIHYCWFGNNPKPPSAIKCIESWRKYCPDYEIIEWNEKNFDININLYCKQAYEAKKWAFLTDFARLWIIYENGGIYLDTDVEIIKPFDPLLNKDCFIGRQPGYQLNTGAGFGAIAGHKAIKIMLDGYQGIPFIKENGEIDLLTCPHRNSEWFFKNGLRNDDSYQEICEMCVYPIEYFSPKDAYSRFVNLTKNTYSIHHCDGSWNPKETKIEHLRRYIKFIFIYSWDYIIHIPNRILIIIIGKDKYKKLKEIIKGDIK